MSRAPRAAESPSEPPEPGQVEREVAIFLASLTEPPGALGAIALALARALDTGSTMAASANAKELKATLKELTPDDGNSEFSRLVASLSA